MAFEQTKPGIPYVPFPIAFHTADIVPFSFKGNEFIPSFLFGRKPAEKKFRCIGGFIDPTDRSAEFGAYRELEEEANAKPHRFDYEPFLGNPFKIAVVGDYEKHVHKLNYIGSFNNGDPRFTENQHKVITSLYIVLVNPYEIKDYAPGDDIAEIKWFSVEELQNLDNFEKVHHLLIKALYERCLA